MRSFADRRVRYVRREMNGGVAAARGAYVSFLDSDDEYLPTKLETQLSLLRGRDPQAGAVECGLKIIEDGRESTMPPNLRGIGYEDLLEFERGVQVSPLLMRRELADAVRFDESLPSWEDWDFVLRLSERCGLVFVDEPLVVLHRHTGPRLSALAVLLEGLQRLYRKYEAELKMRPKARSSWHFKMARFHVRLGEVPGARREFPSAIRAWPWNPKRWILFAATLLGANRFFPVYRAYVRMSLGKKRLQVVFGDRG